MFGLRWLQAFAAFLNLAALAASSPAEVFYVKPLADLQIVEGELPARSDDSPQFNRFWQRRPYLQPYAVLEGEGEIYVQPQSDFMSVPGAQVNLNSPSVAIRTDQPRDITGKIFFPKSDFTGMTAVKFAIPSDHSSADARDKFLEIKLQHYRELLGRGLPGAAWFRRQVRETSKQLGRSESDQRGGRQRPFNFRGDSLDDSYALISGGRAISENLQLDRLLPDAEADAATIALDSIKGVTVKPFDWKPLVKDAQPQRDPLAALIPDDQYALLFPSFQAFVDLADHAAEHGTVVLAAAEPRSEDARVRHRYERQLGLELSQLARLLGPAMIEGVALTGADPYLRTGADLAVLFQAKDPVALRQAIDAQLAASAGADKAAKPISGEIDGVAYTGFRSPDRAVCSYVATLGDAVVVANSPVALERLAKTSKGELPSLAKLDEYTFFRTRYPRGDAEESALLILTDATIRKWCGPRWRIAASRRTRAAALMADMQAAHLDDLVAGKVAAGPLHTDLALPDAGEFTLGPDGVQSSVYGTLEFLTPIVELEFTHVTKREAEFYERWRQGYERNWSTFFDPIAVRFHASAKKIAADLTVMPLIDFSDYREIVAVSRGAKIGADTGDPHPGTIIHGVFALNTEAAAVKQAAGMAAAMANVDPLSWIGQSIAVYLDDDPLWAELAQVQGEREMQRFTAANAYRLPLAANIEIKSGLKLIAFLAGVRTFIEQAAPGMTAWEPLKYRDQSYVKVSPSATARSGNDWDNVAVYYAPGGEALVVTLSEDVLKRAIDRQIERREKKAAGQPLPPANPRWLGENLCLAVDGKLVKLLQTSIGQAYHDQMQLRSWSNLPILNEWHARFPDQDPLAVHQQFWQRKLVCPGGGEYRWNDRWQTMESTAYGHPAEPRHGAALPSLLRSLSSANFGQTFEPHGLRARLELVKESESAVSPP